MLKYRFITGFVLIALVLAIFWFDGWLETVELQGTARDLFSGRDRPPPGLAVFVLALLIMPFAALELTAIFAAQEIRTRRWLTVFAAELGLVLSYAVYVLPDSMSPVTGGEVLGTGLFAVFVIALLTFSRNQNVSGVVAAAGAIVFSMVYLGLMLGFLLALRRDHSAWWIVGIILVTKSADIGAYFTGKTIGRHKLIPWLSPGKTWEGLLGGMVFAAFIGAGFAGASLVLQAPQDHVPLWLGMLCGVAFTVVGLFGDLTMSLFKRGAGIKDSSTLLPGLGGVLDVLDSPLFVAPVSYWMLTLLG